MTPLQTDWGWLIVWYLFLAGVGAGAYIAAALADLLGFKTKLVSKIGVALGAPLVLVGTLLLFLDLGQPANFIYIFSNPSSMITIGSAILTIFIILGAVHIGFWIWPFKSLEKAEGARHGLSVLGCVFAFGTAIYTGVLLGVVNAIPFWNNAIVPMLFLISAVSTGFAAVILGSSIFYGRRTGEEQGNIMESMKRLTKTDAVLVAAELLAVLFYLAIASTIGPDAYDAVQLLTVGSLAPIFWGALVGFGLVLPLAIESVAVFREKVIATGTLTLLSALGGMLILMGGLALRFSVVAAGISVAPPHYTSGQDVYFSAYLPAFVSGLTPTYGPSAFDYVMLAALFIILLAIYFVGAKIIPAPKAVTAKKP